MAKILNKENMIDLRINQSIVSGVYHDSVSSGKFGEVVKTSNGQALESKVIAADSGPWEGSEGHTTLWNQIEDLRKKVKNQIDRKVNVEQFPDDYYTLVDAMRLDLTRRRMEERDLTAVFSNEVVNPNFSKSVTLDEFLPYVGEFQEIRGSGDNVPMIQSKTGVTGSIIMKLYGLGFERSLESELYDTDIYGLEKVQRAVTRAYTGKRNNISVGSLVAKTAASGWDAGQQQAADATSGATKDELMYNTINSAIELIGSLKDPQTNQEIETPKLVIMCRHNDVRRINRAINGQLNINQGQPQNFSPLEVDEIWPYRGDTLYYGEKKVEYNGVAANKAYMFVPGPSGAPIWTAVKRGLTQEVGRGSVLSLSREQRAWYFGQQKYDNEFFGSSDSTVFAKVGTGYGWVIEITLPAA